MADKKWIKMFPIANYGEFNLDFLLEKYGEQDDRIKKVEEKNAEQDDRLDEDDTLIANLRADLTTETNQRTAADNSLSDRITAEVAARIAGDSTLQGNIDAEKAARQAADAQLSTDIASEASARAAADTALQSSINAEATARANADNSLLGNIQQEQLNRITMDQGLQAEIDAIPVVKANDTTGTAGGDLTSLKVGDTSYTVPQGGQGTTVVANPSGAATAGNLTKLQVGSDIYNVPSGGSARNVLYIFFDEYAAGAYRVRYLYTDYETDPSTQTWSNAVSATTGISAFGQSLASALQSSNIDVVFIDAVNYYKDASTPFDITDVHGMSGHANVVVPYIQPEIGVWMDHNDTNAYHARIAWESYELSFSYRASGNDYEGIISYDAKNHGYSLYLQNDYVYEFYSSDYALFDHLKHEYSYIDYGGDLYTLEMKNNDNMYFIYSSLTSASASGYTVKKLVIIPDVDDHFHVAKYITETHA